MIRLLSKLIGWIFPASKEPEQLTDQQLANALQTDLATVERWKYEHPE